MYWKCLIDFTESSTASYFTGIAKDDKNNIIIGDIINTVFHNMFRHFIWRNHHHVLLPARGSVKIPVKFNQNLARSSISECYTIAFTNDEHTIPDQVKIVFHNYAIII